MTISNTVRTAGPFLGAGTTAVLPFGFKVFQAADLFVVRTGSDLTQTPLVLSYDYTVALNSDQNVSAGGFVTLLAPLASGDTVFITSKLAITQPLRLTNAGGFFAQNIEDELDRLTILLQQLDDRRNLRVPEPRGINVLPDAASRAGRALTFDSFGQPALVPFGEDSASALALSLLAPTGAGLVNFQAGSTLRTVASKLRELISVRDFGAVGDGITDDTAAIQAALDSVAPTTWTGTGAGAYTRGGGSVRLPPGRYRITDTLRVGSNTELYGAGPTGSTAASITTQTGSQIICDFTGNQKRWAISSATFETAGGAFAPFATFYSGSQHDGGSLTLTYGIRIRGISINAAGAYGGIRLIASSGFEVHDCAVYGVGVGFAFNTCYGGRYSKLQGNFSLYGLFMRQCNAIEGGQAYMDKTYSTWSNVAGDTTTRLVSVADMGSAAFMPDWTNKTFAFYADGCLGLSLAAHTGEHADVGLAFANVSGFTLTGYFEGNVQSNAGFVTSAGQVTVFANATTSGNRYHFGVNNSIELVDCTIGGIYVGNAQNSVRVSGNGSAANGTDWTWNDSLTFVGLKSLLVSATGSTSAVYGYTTFDEALRRIAASAQRDWVVKIKDGDTVATASQISLTDKDIAIQRETGGTKPNISVGAAGGGFVFRWSLLGDCRVRLRNVNIAFPSTTAAATDNALINAGGALNLTFTAENVIVSLGGAYSLFGTFANTAMNLRAAWATCGITATTPAALLRNTGAALIANIQADTTMDSGIKAIGTNGWQGTVTSSNFP